MGSGLIVHYSLTRAFGISMSIIVSFMSLGEIGRE